MHESVDVYMYLTASSIMEGYFYVCTCRFGPLINHWTTRFEAKHKYFKHVANIMGNFTNICYSLALRHQLHQCYLTLNSDDLRGKKIEIGPGMLEVLVCVVESTCVYQGWTSISIACV